MKKSKGCVKSLEKHLMENWNGYKLEDLTEYCILATPEQVAIVSDRHPLASVGDLYITDDKASEVLTVNGGNVESKSVYY